MTDQIDYKERVRLAARTFLARPGMTMERAAYLHQVQPDDVYRKVREMGRKDDRDGGIRRWTN